MRIGRGPSGWGALVCLLIATLPPQRLTAQTPDAPSSPFVLGRATPQELRSYTSADLDRAFPEFHHRAFDDAGFNALQLPLHYSDMTHAGDPAEALSFAFLLSDAMDWSPGSYCTCHAFIAFRSSRDLMQRLAGDYAARDVASAINYWGATHAIGGKLNRVAGGYTGELIVFDRQGKPAYTKEYTQPMTYWDLLGNFAADAMTFLGDEPNDSLKAFLRQPRCKNMQTLVDLGKTAYLFPKDFTTEVLTYDKLLRAEPDFAELRCWDALEVNQFKSNFDSLGQQLRVSLKSRLTPMGLVLYRPEFSAGQTQRDSYAAIVDQARKLADPDSPIVLRAELYLAAAARSIPQSLLDRATQAAAKYPNSEGLLEELALCYGSRADGVNDPYMAASIDLATIENLARSANGAKPFEVRSFLDQADRLGLCDAGIVAAASDLGKAGAADWRYFRALTYMGRFQEVIDGCRQVAGGRPESKVDFAPYLAFAAAMIGDRDELDRCLTDPNAATTLHGMHDTLRYCAQRLAGEDTSSFRFAEKPDWEFAVLARALIVAEADLARQTQNYRTAVGDFTMSNPEFRLLWIVRDGYEKQSPSEYADQFYLSLEWLHPDDPWVKSAVADYKTRAGGSASRPINAEAVLGDLKEFDAPADSSPNSPLVFRAKQLGRRLTPWRIVQAVRQFAESSQTDNARLLARRYRTVGLCMTNPGISALASEMLRRIDGVTGTTQPAAATTKN